MKDLTWKVCRKCVQNLSLPEKFSHDQQHTNQQLSSTIKPARPQLLSFEFGAVISNYLNSLLFVDMNFLQWINFMFSVFYFIHSSSAYQEQCDQSSCRRSSNRTKAESTHHNTCRFGERNAIAMGSFTSRHYGRQVSPTTNIQAWTEDDYYCAVFWSSMQHAFLFFSLTFVQLLLMTHWTHWISTNYDRITISWKVF